MTAKGSFLIEDILSASKSAPTRVIDSDPPPASSTDVKMAWPLLLDSSPGLPGPSTTVAVDREEMDKRLASLSDRPETSGFNLLGLTAATETSLASPAMTVAVPFPLTASHFPSFSYANDHKPLNLAAKARLPEMDDSSILNPVVTLSKIPLNVPSYVPKFKGIALSFNA